jgi:hypothetical protein
MCGLTSFSGSVIGWFVVHLGTKGRRCLEDDDTPRRDRRFNPRFRISAHAFALVPDDERAEGRELDVLASTQRVDDLGQQHRNEHVSIGSRHSSALVDGCGEIGARHGHSRDWGRLYRVEQFARPRRRHVPCRKCRSTSDASTRPGHRNGCPALP